VRVALDATPLLAPPTGVGAFTQGALRALARRPALEVSAFAVSWRRRAGIMAGLPDAVSVRQRAMPARPLQAIWRRADLPPVEWFIGDVDVVHGTNFVVPPSRRAAAVVSVHDLTPLHHPELCDAPTLLYPGLIRRALRRDAWVHTDSAFVAAEVVEAFRADPRHVVTVPPGIPPLPEVDDEHAARVVRGALPEGTDRYVLAIGTAEPRKDLPGLVDAFDRIAASHPTMALVLAGPPGWGEAALGDALAGARASARMVRTGWLEAPDLAALLRRASVLAFPSRYEGFGFPPLQAMAAGVPVVATRAGSLPEVLGDAALLVEVGDRDALAHALDRVLSEPELRRALVDAGRARAARFTWDACGEGLESLYVQAAAARA